MIATKFKIGSGIGRSKNRLVSFDEALLEAGVGNYNLVRLSSILPAECKLTEKIDLPEGSLLPTAYATIGSDWKDDHLVSTIGVGIPIDKNNVGIIMEYSAKNKTSEEAVETLKRMIREAFENRGWELQCIMSDFVEADVAREGEYTTTFACIAEW